MDKKWTFQFTETEANTIIAGLSKMPYENSAGLISNIQLQYNLQNKPEKATPEAIPVEENG